MKKENKKQDSYFEKYGENKIQITMEGDVTVLEYDIRG